jgi:hypothetical protein
MEVFNATSSHYLKMRTGLAAAFFSEKMQKLSGHRYTSYVTTKCAGKNTAPSDSETSNMQAMRAAKPYMQLMNTLFDVMNGINVDTKFGIGGRQSRHRAHKQLNVSNCEEEMMLFKRLAALFQQGAVDIDTSGGEYTQKQHYFTWQSQHIGSVICHAVCSLLDDYAVKRPGSSLDLSVFTTDFLEIHFGDMKQRSSQLTAQSAVVHDGQANAMNHTLCEFYLNSGGRFMSKKRKKRQYKGNMTKKEDNVNKHKTKKVQVKKNRGVKINEMRGVVVRSDCKIQSEFTLQDVMMCND